MDENEIKFLYLVILLFSIYVFSQYDMKISTIFGVVLSLFIIYELDKNKNNLLYEKNFTIYQKAKYLENIMDDGYIKQITELGLRNTTYVPGFDSSVQIDNYLYTDPDLVLLLYNIKDYERYSQHLYLKILTFTNFILKLRKDMELKDKDGKTAIENAARHYSVAESLKKTATNYFHSFVYSLPLNTYYKFKYKRTMKRYILLLERNLDIMKKIAYKQTDSILINNNTIFIPQYDQPKPNDPSEEKHFHWFV